MDGLIGCGGLSEYGVTKIMDRDVRELDNVCRSAGYIVLKGGDGVGT